MTIDRRHFLGMAGTLGVIGTAGCLGSGEDGDRTTPGGPEPARTVDMVTGGMPGGPHYFDPIGVSVAPGETVRWVNSSGTHSSTAYEKSNAEAAVTRIPDGAAAWNSTTLSKQEAAFDHTFEANGTYDYFCIPHRSLGMVGRVVVGDPGGPAEGSMPPDGEVPDSRTIVDRGVVSYGEFVG